MSMRTSREKKRRQEQTEGGGSGPEYTLDFFFPLSLDCVTGLPQEIGKEPKGFNVYWERHLMYEEGENVQVEKEAKEGWTL